MAKNDGKPETKAQRNSRHDAEDQAVIRDMTLKERNELFTAAAKLKELNEKGD